jgi:hypothetical protein
MGYQKNQFLTQLHASVDDASFVKLTLGHPSESASELKKLFFRPVLIRAEKRCCIVSRFKTRDETRNVSFGEALEAVEAQLGTAFLSAHLATESEEAQLELSGFGKKERLRVTPVAHAPALLGHDRIKPRWVDPRGRYLSALGVTDPAGKIRMSEKFRQIERFVDLLASAFRESALASEARRSSAQEPITLCDMGSGKGYLTFAAYDYFQRVAGLPLKVTGVEARPDLVKLCNRVADECGFAQLRFLQSTIEELPPALPLDILVALHACDTATDDALAAGVRAGSSIILVAPCCHKELRPQVDQAAATGPLRDVLRYGIFAERHSEIATDALRALLLEHAGYRVRVSEFVAAEHTAKNVMIIATRRPDPLSAGMLAEIAGRISELKAFYGIQHHRFEQLLLAGRQLGCAAAVESAVSSVR